MGKVIRQDLPEDHPSGKHWTISGVRLTKPEKSTAPKKQDISNIKPDDDAQDLITIGLYHLESGIKIYSEWSKKMVEDAGRVVLSENDLKCIWTEVQKIYKDFTGGKR